MRVMRWSFVACAALAGGCARPAEVEPAPIFIEAEPRVAVAPPVEQPGGPVLGKLRTHDRVLTIHSTEQGPRFSVAMRDGTLVARDLDEAELAARHRELSAIYRAATARSSAYLDASVDPALIARDAR